MKSLKRLCNLNNWHLTHKKEPFEELFKEIAEIYNDYVACISLTESNSIYCIDEYKDFRKFLYNRGLRSESVDRIYTAIVAELNKIADDDAEIL